MAARGRTGARPYLAVACLCALACWAAVTRAATVDPAAAERHFNLVSRPPLFLGHTSYILGNENSNLCYSITRMAWPPHVGPAAVRMLAAAHASLARLMLTRSLPCNLRLLCLGRGTICMCRATPKRAPPILQVTPAVNPRRASRSWPGRCVCVCFVAYTYICHLCKCVWVGGWVYVGVGVGVGVGGCVGRCVWCVCVCVCR
jgi:hypothetical protein